MRIQETHLLFAQCCGINNSEAADGGSSRLATGLSIREEHIVVALAVDFIVGVRHAVHHCSTGSPTRCSKAAPLEKHDTSAPLHVVWPALHCLEASPWHATKITPLNLTSSARGPISYHLLVQARTHIQGLREFTSQDVPTMLLPALKAWARSII
jgi:hypothetical protein